VTVADLIVPKDVEVKADAEHVLATVFEPSALQAANEDAGGDAEAGEATQVESENESNVTEGDQAAEDKPGGKAEN
jgi:hypothetical protein